MKMDWLEYLKNEGFLEDSSPETKAKLNDLLAAQTEFQKNERVIREANLKGHSPCPVGVTVNLVTSAGMQGHCGQLVAFHLLLDLIRKQEARIAELEKRVNL